MILYKKQPLTMPVTESSQGGGGGQDWEEGRVVYWTCQALHNLPQPSSSTSKLLNQLISNIILNQLIVKFTQLNHHHHPSVTTYLKHHPQLIDYTVYTLVCSIGTTNLQSQYSDNRNHSKNHNYCGIHNYWDCDQSAQNTNIRVS